jgi:hypothetical protein
MATAISAMVSNRLGARAIPRPPKRLPYGDVAGSLASVVVACGLSIATIVLAWAIAQVA